MGGVQRAGGLVAVLPVDACAPDRLVDALDALVLIGGADVDPSTYGAERDPATDATYPERDRFEIAVLARALERGLSVLGICRGMQIQAVDSLGEGLAVRVARSRTAWPEAIEATDGRWVLGVQWHPEAEDESAILAALVAAARRRARERGRAAA